MHPRGWIDLTAELLMAFRTGTLPADRVAAAFLKEKKFLGANDRRIVGDAYFHVLRHLARLDESIRIALEDVKYQRTVGAGSGFPVTIPPVAVQWTRPAHEEDRPRRGTLWIDSLRATIAADDLKPGLFDKVVPTLVRDWPFHFPELPPEVQERLLRRAPELFRQMGTETRATRLALKHSFPEWLWGLLGFGLKLGEMDDFGAALNSPAPPCVRVNTLRTSVEEAARGFDEAQVTWKQSALVPECLVLDRRIPQGKLPGFDRGWMEFQDEGSQLATRLIAPEPGAHVIDACAGAGGKALHFAALMQDRGRIRVHDTSKGRMKNLRERATRAELKSIEELKVEKAAAGPQGDGDLADLVLVDAPCTGTGTLRRSPELKWRLTREILQQRAATQRGLLDAWSRWVRPGGRLAYITCSLLNEENGAQAQAFLSRAPQFRIVDLTDRVPEGLKNAVTREGCVQLLPHRHGTDGFFIALFERGTE